MPDTPARPTEIRLRAGSPQNEYETPGDAWLAHFSHGEPILLLACPGCGLVISLSRWETVVHADGTITLQPSILEERDHAGDAAHLGCGAHFFIRRNRIEWC